MNWIRKAIGYVFVLLFRLISYLSALELWVCIIIGLALNGLDSTSVKNNFINLISDG